MLPAASAEALEIKTHHTAPNETSWVIAIAERPEDELERRRAANYLRLGSTTINNEVELETGKVRSLKEAIDRAQTDPRAMSYISLSVATDVTERVEKVEFVSSVELEIDEQGELVSTGQSLKQAQLNSWHFASSRWQMAERVQAENRNVFRLQSEQKRGTLEDNMFVEISPSADNLSKSAMAQEGFFTDTMSLAIRTTSIKNGVVTMESAFVAGVKKSGEERHDLTTLEKMGEILGVDFSDKTAADIIDSPMLIPKEYIPNGIVDLVKLYDHCAGGTFFGQDKEPGNYEEVVARSAQRTKSFEQKVTDIANELVARKGDINNKKEASIMLNRLSGKHMILAAVKDKTINARVFGITSERYIYLARQHEIAGNIELAWAATQKAVKNDTSKSCAGSASDSSKVDVFGNTINDKEKSKSKIKPWHGGKVYKNKKCRSCNKVQSEVGACHVCQDCVGEESEVA